MKNLKTTLLCICIMLNLKNMVLAQSEDVNLKKYWDYRDRLFAKGVT